MKDKTVKEAINHRRSVRIFDAEKPIDVATVKECIAQASLAPTAVICNCGNSIMCILRL